MKDLIKTNLHPCDRVITISVGEGERARSLASAHSTQVLQLSKASCTSANVRFHVLLNCCRLISSLRCFRTHLSTTTSLQRSSTNSAAV